MKWLSGVLVAFAVANLAMGIQAASKSPISLVAGSAVAALALFGAWYGLKKPSVGYAVGAVSTLMPLGQFLPKYIKDPANHVYPQLVGSILCFITLGCLIYGHFAHRKQLR